MGRLAERVGESVGDVRQAGRGPRSSPAHASRPMLAAIRWSLTLPLTLTGTLADLRRP